MKVEVQDVFREHFQDYLRGHKISNDQYKAMISIINCRTSALGGRVEECPECK